MIDHKISEGGIPYQPATGHLIQTEEQPVHPFQYADRYILVSSEQGLMVVDQHRAHVRVLFERFLADAKAHGAASQGLLFPEMFQLSQVDAAAFSELKPRFAALGFDISDMGRGAL